MPDSNIIVKTCGNIKYSKKKVKDEIILNESSNDSNKSSPYNNVPDKEIKKTEFEKKNTKKNKIDDSIKNSKCEKEESKEKEQEKYKYKGKLDNYHNEADKLGECIIHSNHNYISRNQKLNKTKKKKNIYINKLNSVEYLKILNGNSEKQFNDAFYNSKRRDDPINSLSYILQNNDILSSNFSLNNKEYNSNYSIKKEKNMLNNVNVIRYHKKKKGTPFGHTSKNRDNNISSTFQNVMYNNDKFNAIYGELKISKEKRDDNNNYVNLKDTTIYEHSNFEADISSNSSCNKNQEQIINTSDENKLVMKKNISDTILRDTNIFDEKKKLKNKKYSFNLKISQEKKFYENIKNNHRTKIKNKEKFHNSIRSASKEIRKNNLIFNDEDESNIEITSNNNKKKKKEFHERNKLKKKGESLNMEVNDKVRNKIRCTFKIKNINTSIRSQTNLSNNLHKKLVSNLNEFSSDNSNKKYSDTMNKKSQDYLPVNLKHKKMINKKLDNLLKNEKEEKNKKHFLENKAKEKYLRKEEYDINNNENINYYSKCFNNKGIRDNKISSKETAIKKIDNSENTTNKKGTRCNYYMNAYRKQKMRENDYNYEIFITELIKNYKYLDQKMKNYINEQIKYYGKDLRKENIENINLYIMKNFENKKLESIIKRTDNTILTNYAKKNYFKKLEENIDNKDSCMDFKLKLLSFNNKEAHENISASSSKEEKKHIEVVDDIKRKYIDCDFHKIKNDDVFIYNCKTKKDDCNKKKKKKKLNITKKNNLKELENLKLDEKKCISFSEIYSYLTSEKNILRKILNEKEKKNKKCHLKELNEIEKKMIKFIDNFEKIITRKDEKLIYNDKICKKGTTFQVNVLLKILDEIIQIINNHFNSNKEKVPNT